jgi:trimeric autotransporter adhesin
MAGNQAAQSAPSTDLSPSTITFSSAAVGTATSPQVVTVTNSGNADMSVSSIAISGTDAGDFSQTNNCGASLAAGTSCSISVTFKPAATGTSTAAINLSDDASGSPQTVALSGRIATTVANVSPASLSLGSVPLSTASAVQAITLSNTGSGSLSISSVAVSGADAANFTETNNCGANIAAGDKCTISVTFKPAATGTRTASVEVADTAPNSPQTVTLSGTGMAPVASVSATSVAFGNQAVGTTSASHAVTLKNTGNEAMSITRISVLGTNSTDFAETNNCGTSLAASASCTVELTFEPSVAGALAGDLTITDDAAGSPQSVALTGTGTSTAANVSPSSVAFGNQSIGVASAAHAVTLTNSGNSALTVSSIAIAGTNASSFAQTNNCGSSVAAGASCTISLTFTPSAASALAGTLAITDNAAGSPQAVPLSGTGVSTGVTVSPSSVAFGNQAVGAASAAHTVTLTNTGNSALTVSSIAVDGANASNFAQTNNCGNSLAASASCTISLTFTPSAAGALAGTLAITDNAAGSPQAVPLSGTGVSTGVTLSPSSVAFGNESVGVASAAESVTLTNSGSSALTVSSIAVSGTNPGDFTENSTCGASVAAGGTCTIVLVFTPAASGARAAVLSVADNATGSPQSVALSGTGGSASGHNVVLTWTASTTTGIAGYNIYRGTTSGEESTTPINTSPVTAITFTDDEVTAGDEYFYVVTSISSDGVTQSSASPEASASIP